MFQGFDSPQENWSKLPHQFIELLPKFTSISEMKVVLYILRHTWGYREFDKPKKITLDEFINGRKYADGSRIDKGTGLAKSSVIDGLKRAEKSGFIVSSTDDSDKARTKKLYAINSGVQLSNPDVQDLDPEVQLSNPRGTTSVHRTEKETIERNNKKETIPDEQSSPEPSPAPSEETALPATQAPPKIELKDHMAVKAFREVHELNMKKKQYKLVQHIENKDIWVQVMTRWMAKGYNPHNLDGQLEWYERDLSKYTQGNSDWTPEEIESFVQARDGGVMVSVAPAEKKPLTPEERKQRAENAAIFKKAAQESARQALREKYSKEYGVT